MELLKYKGICYKVNIRPLGVNSKLNNINRLFNPKNIAVFGGNDAEIVISNAKMGFKVKFGQSTPIEKVLMG